MDNKFLISRNKENLIILTTEMENIAYKFEGKIFTSCKRCGTKIIFPLKSCESFPKGFLLKKPHKCACGLIIKFMKDAHPVKDLPKLKDLPPNITV